MKEYVISCNLERFDLIKHFSHDRTVIWRQTKPCIPGDFVFVYIGRPYSRLYYRCKVVKSNIDNVPDSNAFYKNSICRQRNPKYMELELVNTLPDSKLGLAELLNNGLKTVQCSTQVSEELHNYIYSIERKKK